MPWGEFKDTAAERRLFQRRTLVMLVIVMLAIGGLIARMYQLQVVEHEIYTTLSDKNRVQVQSVPPPRGLVYDRNNTLLAENRPVFSVTLVPERVQGMDVGFPPRKTAAEPEASPVRAALKERTLELPICCG